MPASIPLFRRLYYAIKPYVPWGMRMALRRSYARRLLEQYREVWPIQPGAEKKPPGWMGWPEGKQFAFVVVHDVEGLRGIENCGRLIKLESDLGFRSGFFFIPEGSEYRVLPELRQQLGAQRFEVGVHDLHHNGKLYSSREGFRRKAEKINRYLKEWGAVGFRSGFMHHNLEWIHDLDVEYDGSTFDTDPFEPQPDGVGTIFPFWVPRPAGGEAKTVKNPGDTPQSFHGGYVEMPYTLPQDSTIFALFEERDISIWKKKIDWIAERGGMALINVHPDFMAFNGQAGSARTFPSDLFAALLKHVSGQYGNGYWNGTPGEVARFFRDEYLRKRPSAASV